MLKFFSARDDENESLLGALTDDELDAPSLMDAKHHWLHRPCLLMLEDGDVTKPGQLGCGHIGSESPAKSKIPGATKEGPISQLETPAQRLMRQLEEGNCAVTTLSTWGERHFGKASTPLMLIPTNVPEVEMKEEKKRPQLPSFKEDSVVEEKELEESERKLQDSPSGSDGIGPDLDATSDCPVEDLYEGSQTQGPRLGLQNQTKANGLTNDETNANRAHVDSEEGAVGDCTPSSMSPSVDPDNELQAGPTGILSKERGTILGEVAPVWVPDAHTLVCMMCEVRFTFTKRRHHCRACGKVFCSVCSGLKFRLTHLDGKEGRVCVSCHSTLVKGTPPRGRRRVWFADEILSNEKSDSAPCTPIRGPTFSPLLLRKSIAATIRSATGSPQTSRRTSIAQGPPLLNPLQEVCGPCGWGTATLVSSHISSSANLIPLDGLPPILTSTGVKGDYTVEERPSERVLIQDLESGRPNSLVFVLNANLLAMVKLVNYVNRKCWCVTSKGMHAVGQVEVVVLLQCLPEEKSFPKDIFSHFIQLYRDALTGKVLSHLGLSQFSRSFLGCEEHAGFLWVRSTLQSLQGLPMPNQPFLFGLLIHQAEVPWAKAFPLRLMLRLGAEYRFYPCPLYSVRFRKALFGETGHTIMRLLVDFRNYRYTCPPLLSLETYVYITKASEIDHRKSLSLSQLMKALNKSNEHVLAMGACFNVAADSHLICVQGDDGEYQTQAISIHNQPRKVTGSCFFLFSGALKAASGYLAKSSIVEDGLMVQITVETMVELRRSLREMKDYNIPCERIDQSDSQEHVQVQWQEKECTVNKGVISPIDGKSMESISSIKMFQKSEYKANGKVIRWTEVFSLQKGGHPKSQSDHHTEHSRLTERLARAFCLALGPHLKLLKEDGMAKLGLRVTLDSHQVGFVAGSNGLPLPAPYLKALETVLIPIIHSRGRKRSEEPLVMELIFYILENIS
ncbi:zinc finger FYVE domain-containing protein 9 [Oncorhynchus masou masou]|uniref:zinc finger FYVE domain-containing protein 9 n=1 Tax=Oncorhynchus masou masou TaxID=90313 RepID=UPI003182BF98